MNSFRNFLHTLRHYKTASLLNLLGLSVAFAAFTILIAQVRFDLTFNRQNPDCEAIHLISLPIFFQDEGDLTSDIPRPTGEKLISCSPSIKEGGCIHGLWGDYGALYDQEQGPSSIVNYQACYRISQGSLDLFGFQCVAGSFDRFNEPDKIILSEKTAKAVYGNLDPIGRSLVVNRDAEHPCEVIAVYKDFPQNTSLSNGAVTNLGKYFLNVRGEWNFHYFVKLDSPKNAEKVRQAMIAELKTLRSDIKPDILEKIELIPFPDIYFSHKVSSFGTSHGNAAMTYSLLTVAILILLIAMINFVNLDRKSVV